MNQPYPHFNGLTKDPLLGLNPRLECPRHDHISLMKPGVLGEVFVVIVSTPLWDTTTLSGLPFIAIISCCFFSYDRRYTVALKELQVPLLSFITFSYSPIQ